MDDLVTSLKRASEGLKLASVAWKARGGKWVVEGEALSEISIVTDSAASEISRLRGEVENFKQAGAEWRSQALVHADELATLRAENEKLRGALEPFKREADRIDPLPGIPGVIIHDNVETWQSGSEEITRSKITYGNLRDARAALTAAPAAPEQEKQDGD